MTTVDSFDETPHPPPLDARPGFPRSNSTPWSETPSLESISSVKSRVSSILTPPLRKRHSTYVLSSPPDIPKAAVPGMPPQRPLRNPARGGPGIVTAPTKPKAQSRPSTATGTREEVTPWEFVPGPELGEVPNDMSSINSSGGGSSPLSTRTRASLPTGTVEEVTPWELYPVQTQTTRTSLNTGLVEEVTPWELYPIPTTTAARSTLATGLIEEVTPWELYPTPKHGESPNSASLGQRYSRSSPRVSTSSSQGRTLSDLAQIRRRKSTGAKAMKARSNTLPTSILGGANLANVTQSETSLNHPGSSSKSAPTTPKISHRAAVASSAHPLPSLPPAAPSKFSTADRTIYEELKRTLRARVDQFIFKSGKKHHSSPIHDVPYPRNFERDVLDLDVWETAFCQDICESLTWHVFETPPSKVLDLGCGTGTWILNCARIWNDCQFVGLDVVPLHPDLQQVGSPDLASRITWVQANFLEGLPFPNEEFDYVHVKRIALGVPEDKWDLLLEEISRVTKPGGAFEMLEEDLFFPGRTIDDDSDSEPETDFELPIPQRISHQDRLVLQANGSEEDQSSTLVASSGPSEISGEGLHITPLISSETLAGPLSPLDSPEVVVSPTDEEASDDARELLAQVYVDYSPALQPFKVESPVTPLSPQPTARSILHVNTPTQPHHPEPRITGSAFSLLMSTVANIPPPDLVEVNDQNRPRGYSLTKSLSSNHENNPIKLSIPHHTENIPDTPSSPVVKSPHFLLRTIPKPPLNPRDHTLLETIYTEMLGARFINIAPLALLANSLGLYFKDVRTHPPLQYAFPPVSDKPPSYRSARRTSFSDTDYTSDSDDARDAILPGPLPRSAAKRRSSNRFSTQSADSEDATSISEDNRYLNVRGLIHRSSPYITLDESRILAFSPSTKTTFPSGPFKDGKSKRGSRLPNTTMNLDQRSLNLHLALRVAEVLACSESMWEWVSGYQAKNRSRKTSGSRVGVRRPGSVDSPQRSAISMSSGHTSINSLKSAILDLSRDEFDGLLSQFDMDMRDHFALGDALRDRFGWSVMSSSPPPDRKIFENACEKWDKWEHEQHHRVPSHPYRSQNRLSKSRATVNSSQGHPTRDSVLENQERNGKRGSEDHSNSPILSHSRQQDSRSNRSSISGGLAALPPTRRLSRAMRVFVAWKA